MDPSTEPDYGRTVYHDSVIGVLLADGWHDVYNRSFAVSRDDSMWRGLPDLGEEPQVCFRFYENPTPVIEGPLESVIAVRTD